MSPKTDVNCWETVFGFGDFWETVFGFALLLRTCRRSFPVTQIIGCQEKESPFSREERLHFYIKKTDRGMQVLRNRAPEFVEIIRVNTLKSIIV